MRDVLTELITLLQLERIEENLFRGPSQDLGWGQVFGGQVLGQALSAAEQTVPDERPCHSLHGYFLRTGDATRPIVYEVDRIRDGRSFTTRRVVAIQGGRAIFNLSASFQVVEPGYDHHDPAPDATPPEDLLSERELARRLGDRIPKPLRKRATAERPIEIRPVDPINPLAPEPRPPHKHVWMRAADPLPDDPGLHRKLLAYASDFHLLTTALRPHGVTWLTRGMQVASLDHAMWFHRPFRVDDWLLYDIVSPSASGARGLVRGRFFDRAGRLVASTAQEGLMRQWSKGTGP
ncbi:MAG: acyl-CoA thioesterase II [Alphaproteobacteria bacterium]|nr:acyl-CoA thioesterase II [Alphaproteobacteria bacterium]